MVDSHVHAFSPDVIEQRAMLADNDYWFGELYANPGAKLTTADDLLASMDDSDIDISVMCGFPWTDNGSCVDHNDYMAVAAGEHPDRLRWLGTVLPTDPGAPREAEQCFRAGAAGIGELNADAQGFDLTQPEDLAPLVEICEEWDRPIMFHISEPVGHMYPGKGTATPDKLLVFLERFPDVRVIAAHWGGGLPFYELMPEVSELTRNVIYDSAASTYLYRFPVFRSAIDIVGPSRILFGSDFPVLGQKKLHRRVKSLSLPSDVHQMIMGGNAQSVFSFS
ncbi:MAG: amidohydrolase [Sphaerobacteraceae bacterium]|nr:MAG: amidohydrolase [Sphaerobacteraceae bacterium]